MKKLEEKTDANGTSYFYGQGCEGFLNFHKAMIFVNLLNDQKVTHIYEHVQVYSQLR